MIDTVVVSFVLTILMAYTILSFCGYMYMPPYPCFYPWLPVGSDDTRNNFKLIRSYTIHHVLCNVCSADKLTDVLQCQGARIITHPSIECPAQDFTTLDA